MLFTRSSDRGLSSSPLSECVVTDALIELVPRLLTKIFSILYSRKSDFYLF